MTPAGSHAEDELLPVRVIALLEEPTMNSPVVILYEPEDNRVLPIWIGDSEARAIAIFFQDTEMVRPLTHSLMANIIEAMGGHVDYVAVEKMEAGTFYAMIYIHVGEEEMVIDARPSDAIALALEIGAPIYVSRSVMDAGGQENPFPQDPSRVTMTSALTPPGEEDRFTPLPAKVKFDPNELEDLKAMLKKAREKEQGGGA